MKYSIEELKVLQEHYNNYRYSQKKSWREAYYWDGYMDSDENNSDACIDDFLTFVATRPDLNFEI